MSINAADYFPPGTPTISNLSIFSGYAPSLSGAVNFTNLTFLVFDGGYDSSGPYNINSSSVTYSVAPGSNYGSFTNFFTGHITSLTMNDSGANETSNIAASMTGQVDSISFNITSSSATQSLTTSQTSTLNVGGVAFNNDGTQAVTINAPDVTSLTVPASMNLSQNATTLNGPFDQASVDAILASAVAGGTTGWGTLTIGGASASPSSAGLSNVATLVGNGISVSTN